MSRRCDLTGTGARSGHNVSHSNRKTNRRFEPNLQNVSLVSEALGRRVPMRITTRALRTVQKRGGLDAFLLKSDDGKLTPEALRLKHRVQRVLSGAKRSSAS